MPVTLVQGDCLDVLPTLAADSIDAIVTDPPYHLTADKPGGSGIASLNLNSPAGRSRIGTGFMGKAWDGGDIAFQPETWAAALRVLKPGGHMLCFGGTRTAHRLACAIEDAGFEIRDTLCWLYGTGFPKSLDVSKAIDRAAGAEREVVGTRIKNTAIGGNDLMRENGRATGAANFCASSGDLRIVYGNVEIPVTAPATPEAAQWSGWGTALKPGVELITLARRPLSEPTVAANVLRHGTGGINVDACRIGDFVNTTPSGVDRRNAALAEAGYRPGAYQMGETTPNGAPGRWPANVVHDGSDAVLEAFAAFGERKSCNSPSSARPEGTILGGSRSQGAIYPGEIGSAARFYYSAKASAADRAGSKHPTVKPIALLEWLVRMITPPGGTVLDPFAGSGTTGAAAQRLGLDALLIEREAEYCADIRRRFADLPPPLQRALALG